MKHYGKRLLAAGLSAAMVLGSVCVVNAQGRVADGSTVWNTSDVDNYTFSEDTSVTVAFKNTPFQTTDKYNWDNFVFETVATSDVQGITMRADAYGWTYGDDPTITCSYEVAYTGWTDWSDFQTICEENTTVTLTASMTSSTVAVFSIVWGDNVATETYTVTYSASVDEISFHVGASGGTVEVIYVEYSGDGYVADGSTVWNTSDVDNYTFSEDTSVTVTFENTPFQTTDKYNWDNFVFETVATSDVQGITMRADAYGWTYGDDPTITCSYEVAYTGWTDWSDFQTICEENTTVTLTASMTSSTVAVFSIVWGDSIATETYTVTYSASVDEISFHVGASGAVTAVKSVSYSVIDFLGGSLRIDGSDDDYSSTSLRFGYSMTLPAGATIKSATWAWGTDASSLTSFTPETLNYVENSDGTITSNLVVTDIPSAYYDTTLYAQISVTYVLADGTEVTETEYSVQSRSVNDVATAIVNSTSATDDEIIYANGILSVNE